MTKLNSHELADFGSMAHYLTYALPEVDGWTLDLVRFESIEGNELVLVPDENGEMAVCVEQP